MPRPKGSKNKTTDLDSINQTIVSLEAEISEMTEQLKAKKASLKELGKQKLAAEAAEKARRAAEDKAQILAAIEASGKSLEEILDLLK